MKNILEKILDKIKEYSSIIIAIIIILIVITPYIILIPYLKKKNKTITIYPTFSIKEINNKSEVDENILSSALRVSQEIVKRIKE